MNIKTRIWDKEYKRWADPSLFGFDANGNATWDTSKLYPPPKSMDEFVVQVSTDLKDTVGTEIFEGDIVETIYDKIIGVVYFDIGLGGFRIIQSDNKSHPIVTVQYVEDKFQGFICTVVKVIDNNVEKKLEKKEPINIILNRKEDVIINGNPNAKVLVAATE